MTERILLIEPHDPAIFRDGRPFTEGLPATTLPFPLPSATAGAIRSRSGENLDFENGDELNRLLSIRQVGPFAASLDAQSGRWELAFPAPADAVPYRVDGGIEYVRLRPATDLPPGGCDLPDELQPLSGARPTKAFEEAPRFWRAGFMLDWLGNNKTTHGRIDPRRIGFNALPVQQRTHVAIDPGSLLARDGMLFTTAGLEFTWPMDDERACRLGAQRAGIVSRVSSDAPLQFPSVAPLGGERRLAFWRELPDSEIAWPSPPKLCGGSSGGLVRVVLVTPAIFSQGWRPSWSQPPDTKDLEMQLVAAAVPRFQPVSGWDLHKDRRGPKPTRFLVPAGSVYFFQCKGDPAQLWMRSICDHEQDRLDGYGIVLLGDC
jgi:CRISPR-associated protein Cmr3